MNARLTLTLKKRVLGIRIKIRFKLVIRLR
jgi:hypothetical protein